MKNGMYGEMPKIIIGKFEISMMTDKPDEKRIWVQKIDYEGGEFNESTIKELEKVIDKWFNKYF